MSKAMIEVFSAVVAMFVIFLAVIWGSVFAMHQIELASCYFWPRGAVCISYTNSQ